MSNKIIVGMDSAVATAKDATLAGPANIMVSADLIIEMANRINELEDYAEDAFYEMLERSERCE